MIKTAAVPDRRPARWQDYVQLLKPRVMSLVVFTALTGLVAAPGADQPVPGRRRRPLHRRGRRRGGRAEHGLDADIDALMRRTRGRPVPAGRVQGADDAMACGVVLSLFSVMLMGMAVNWLAAGLLAFTIVFYAVRLHHVAEALDAAEHRHRRRWPAPCRR